MALLPNINLFYKYCEIWRLHPSRNNSIVSDSVELYEFMGTPFLNGLFRLPASYLRGFKTFF